MLFSSTVFIYYFLPVALFVYYLVFRKKRFLQNIFLFLASLFFYGWGEPEFVFIMILSIIVNWFFGLTIDEKKDDHSLSKLLVALDAAFNVAVLFLFKYLVFTINTINTLPLINLPNPEIALPIGISFFTFQALSYVIDVYRGKVSAQKNILDVGLYISFFPQLIAGPIVRYETVADQIINRRETLDDLFDGFARFVVGLSKKTLLANSFGILADQAFNPTAEGVSVSVMFSWLGAISYTLQIFFDFSGYSDMAIGLGRMFGFKFPENFNYPYMSTSITEFWRRWHISLATWFRDYLYIPLGGSRCSKRRTILNLFIVWFLTGLWHGANFTFIIWGLLNFFVIIFEKSTRLVKKEVKILNAVKWLYTITFVTIGWAIFRSESVSHALRYIRLMFGLEGNAFADGMFTGWFAQNGILLMVGVILSTPLLCKLKQKTKERYVLGYVKAIGLICLFVLSIASLTGSLNNPFIYFNF